MTGSDPLRRLVAESGLDPQDHALVDGLERLRRLSEAEPPVPSPALARALRGASPDETMELPVVPGAVVPLRRTRRRLAAGATALALAGVAATGAAAAAANELPTGVQRVVAGLSDRFLPFRFPQPVVASTDDASTHDDAPSAGGPAGSGSGVGAGSTGSGAGPAAGGPRAHDSVPRQADRDRERGDESDRRSGRDGERYAERGGDRDGHARRADDGTRGRDPRPGRDDERREGTRGTHRGGDHWWSWMVDSAQDGDTQG